LLLCAFYYNKTFIVFVILSSLPLLSSLFFSATILTLISHSCSFSS
ncbi:unnamed protein product, partial [Amoebophrya sp. A25]